MARKIKTLGGLLVLVLIAVAGYQWWLANAAVHPMSMTVTGYQGTVLIDGKALAEDNIELPADGAMIQVRGDSLLNLELSDGSVFQVFENSSANILKAKSNRDATRFDLEFKLNTGEILRSIPKVRKTSEGYSSSLFTNEVNIGVRGTRYGAIADRGLTRTMVYRGAVALATEGHDDVPLDKGFGTLTHVGQAPEAPSRLPAPPEIETVFSGERIEVASFSVNWEPVYQAQNYLLEVARDPEFNNVVYRKYVDHSSHEITRLPYDADYYWRVASIDERGLRGEGSEGDTFRYKYHHHEIKVDAVKRTVNQQLIDRATKGFPDDYDLFHDIAKYMTEHGFYDTALEYYNQVIEKGGNIPEVFLGRGSVLRLLGKHASAESDFGKVLSMPTDSTSALYGLGLVELDRGSPAKAMEYFYQVIANKPDHNEVHISAAKAWEKLGNTAKAQRHMELHQEQIKGGASDSPVSKSSPVP